MFCAGELAHIRPDFADDFLRQVEAETIDSGEVNAGDAAQVPTHLDGGVFGQVFAVGAALVGRQRVLIFGGWVGPVRTNGRAGALNLGVTGLDLASVEVIEFQGLPKDKEVPSRQAPVRAWAISAALFLNCGWRKAASL